MPPIAPSVLPSPALGGDTPPPPPRKKVAEDWVPRKLGREGGRGLPGLCMLTSARLWAEQAQDSFVEGSRPAQLIADAQGWLGHFCYNHWKNNQSEAPCLSL